MKQLIVASECHGPFFYGFNRVRKRSESFYELSLQGKGLKRGVVFYRTNSNKLM